FDYRDYGRELIMCQRYYQSRHLIDYRIYGAGGAPYYSPFTLITAMRADPTVSTSFSYANASNGVVGASADGRAYIQLTVTATGTAYANATSCSFSAEL
ncbi:MAG: hypothetical protein ACK5A0_04635, partial [Polaromonas sp.]